MKKLPDIIFVKAQLFDIESTLEANVLYEPHDPSYHEESSRYYKETEKTITFEEHVKIVGELNRELSYAADSLQEWGIYICDYFKARNDFDKDVKNIRNSRIKINELR